MFPTLPLFMPFSRGALKVWKRRRVFRMTAHLNARKRNVYSLAIRALHRCLRRTAAGNKLKHKDRQSLWNTRIDAACEQLGVMQKVFTDGLDRSNVFLHRQTLANLAVWEPRSFKAICHFGWKRAAEEGINGVRDLGEVPKGIITRGMLKN